jgi:uncharacterized membrane-anchored protein YhcB (DUF1043 family)
MATIMKDNLLLTIIEMSISLIVEGIILTMIFQWIANKSSEKQQQNVQQEMNNIEKQNKFDYQQLQLEIQNARNDIINQIKESNKRGE